MSAKKELYGLFYVNGQQWIARAYEHWGRTKDISAAALFATEGEADCARQALLQEAEDRVVAGTPSLPFWYDIKGGVVTIEPVEIVTRRALRGDREAQALNAGCVGSE